MLISSIINPIINAIRMPIRLGLTVYAIRGKHRISYTNNSSEILLANVGISDKMMYEHKPIAYIFKRAMVYW